MLEYRIVNNNGSDFAILHRGVRVFSSYSIDAIHAWFARAGITNWIIG